MRAVVLLFAVAACVAASSVQASNSIRYGIQDDAWLEFGSGTLNQRFATLKRLGVPLVRFTLHWDDIARQRPKDPTSPRDRAYDWRRPDRVLRGLRRHGLTPVRHAARDARVGERRDDRRTTLRHVHATFVPSRAPSRRATRGFATG